MPRQPATPNPPGILQGRRILLVEDDYLIADELEQLLRDAGAEIVGPVPTVAEALHLAAAEAALDGAVLDINLGGESAFPVADALRARGVHCVFVSGYDQAAIPPGYADIPNCLKPVGMRRLVAALDFG